MLMRLVGGLVLMMAAFGSAPVAAEPEAAVDPLSLSATDVFSTSFAECGAEAEQSLASEDVLAAENLAPCCACVDPSGGLVCKCNYFPCACTPAATGMCRCVCGTNKEVTQYLFCLLFPTSILCQDHAGDEGGLLPAQGEVALAS